MRITISGPPGSGKTTVCRMLSDRLGIRAAVFGEMFRAMAAERGLTLAELGALAERDPGIDRDIDAKIVEVAKANPDMIFESRLSAYMLSGNGIPAFKIYLDASPDVRIARIGLREGESAEDARRETVERQRSEALRYMRYYGIDIGDKSVYDMVIDTDELSPGEVADAIIEGMGGAAC
ncbi:MAG: AAA family ATPase [Candidatus Methanoplasma sp.]|jgi:predicted cytidylate kinase|nr:AAA family ATPase [Candidatus Methanoplasma sp.]